MRDVTPPNWRSEFQFDYPLTTESVIIDAGMFEGGWSAQFFEKFNCRIIGLEPVNEFFQKCSKRFENNTKVKVVHLGLGSEIAEARIHVKGDASSRFNLNDGTSEVARFAPLSSILTDNAIESVDLLKINIEGAEYSVLENIFAENLSSKIKFFQIQFHEGPEYSEARLQKVRSNLSKTHDCQWYWTPMVWESWALRAAV